MEVNYFGSELAREIEGLRIHYGAGPPPTFFIAHGPRRPSEASKHPPDGQGLHGSHAGRLRHIYLAAS